MCFLTHHDMCRIVYDIVRKKLFRSHKSSLTNIEILSCSISPGSISRITNEPICKEEREKLTKVTYIEVL
jgi:hypothetical protein